MNTDAGTGLPPDVHASTEAPPRPDSQPSPVKNDPLRRATQILLALYLLPAILLVFVVGAVMLAVETLARTVRRVAAWIAARLRG